MSKRPSRLTPEQQRLRKLKTFLIPGLRRLSQRWPEKNSAAKEARVERGLYKCANCKNLFKNGEYKLDHKIPIIDPITGFTDWNSYIDRMFCDKSNYQLLCDSCHDAKTMVEKQIRELSKKSVDNDEE